MNTILHRKNTLNMMEDSSMAILYAGIPAHIAEDEYHPFQENSNFFYLTGSHRARQVLVLTRIAGVTEEYIFIEEIDPLMERWTGKMPTREEMHELTGIAEGNIRELSELPAFLSRQINFSGVDTVYFDTFRCDAEDMDDYNLIKAGEFAEKFPHVRVKALRPIMGKIRRAKDEDEISDIKRAIDITDKALLEMLSKLKPGMKEYQAQTIFEASCRYQGAERFAFETIAGTGSNACSMHYISNRDEIKDGDLVLFDLGAKFNNYCSDISRTYPANGRFTERQRAVYEVVLEANKAVQEAAKPGISLRDLNDVARDVLGKGCVKLGLIEKPEDVGKYYMHGVSHFIGIDCHDITTQDQLLVPGAVLSDEPGLYIDEEGIGIRIEDDLLITEDGCINLSADVMKEVDEIESYMANCRC